MDHLEFEVAGSKVVLDDENVHMLIKTPEHIVGTNVEHEIISQLVNSYSSDKLSLGFIDFVHVEFQHYQGEKWEFSISRLREQISEECSRLKSIYNVIHSNKFTNLRSYNLSVTGSDVIRERVVFVNALTMTFLESEKEKLSDVLSMLEEIGALGRAAGVHLVLSCDSIPTHLERYFSTIIEVVNVDRSKGYPPVASATLTGCGHDGVVFSIDNPSVDDVTRSLVKDYLLREMVL